MTTSIQQQINQMQSWTNQQETLKSKTEGKSNEMNQDMFLKLMLQQLRYQDPLNPMSNQDFLAQQAQFTQIEQLTQLNKTIGANNGLSQGVNLMGKEVTILDPNDNKTIISGVVTEAVFYQNGAAVVVNGKEYPAGYVLSAREPKSSSSSQTESITNEAASKLTTITDTMNNLYNTVQSISEYLK